MTRLAMIAVAFAGLAAFAMAETPPVSAEPETRTVFLVHPGPANPPGKSLMENPLIREHAKHMVAMFKAGTMMRGGPFTDGSGGIGIAAKGVTPADLAKILAEDPAAKAGIITYEVKIWMIGVGAP